jgi:phenylacetate-CoA ligase
VEFVGRVEPDAMPGLYEEADIFVNASVVDNQPVSILEAFAAGLPVVTTPPGDIPAMVRDNETGTLVPPDDPEALAAAVAALLESPQRAARMAGLAREWVQQFTWPQVCGAWIDVYRRMLGTNTGRDGVRTDPDEMTVARDTRDAR